MPGDQEPFRYLDDLNALSDDDLKNLVEEFISHFGNEHTDQREYWIVFQGLRFSKVLLDRVIGLVSPTLKAGLTRQIENSEPEYLVDINAAQDSLVHSANLKFRFKSQEGDERPESH